MIPTNEELGLSPAQRAALDALANEHLRAGRVVSEARGEYRLWSDGEERAASCVGRFLNAARGRGDLPAVGDWVALEATAPGEAMVHALLPRTTVFTRRAAGLRDDAQVVAANIDVALLTAGLDGDFNVRRLERYLAVAWESGATPVVLLTKCDLADDLTARVAEAREVAGRAQVIATSARTGDGFDAVQALLAPRTTVAFMGSSGVGKSTAANLLLARDAQRIGDVREHDQRGRHTTTHRELFVLPSGALLIDTPGMRELQLWEVSHGLDAAFEDVTALAAQCRFRDCGHGAEPGCAVREARAQGTLSEARYASWQKLRDEAAHARVAREQRVRAATRGRPPRTR